MVRPKAPTSEYTPSTLPSDQHLVRLGAPQGSNAFLSIDSKGFERLVEMPSKLRRVIHASRGCYAIIKLFPPNPVSPDNVISESSQIGQSRLVGEIMSIVLPTEMKAWKKAGEWPKAFDDEPPTTKPSGESNLIPSDNSAEEEDLPPNPNRKQPRARVESESESSEDDSE